jgi:hypothetical protein
MNKLRPILLLLTAVAALSVAYPASANLITNGGFENGFFGWSHSGTVGLSGNAHSGNQAASFGVPSGSVAQNVTTPGTSYVVDFWLATSIFGPSIFGPTGGINPTVSVNVVWGGTSIFSQSFASPYTEHTFTVTASSAMTALEFQSSIIGPPGSAALLLDDVSVTPAASVCYKTWGTTLGPAWGGC